MLTRNCGIEKLLEEGDFNVRVTIYDPASVSTDPKQQISAWKEVIRDSLGGGVVNTISLYSLSLKTVDRILLKNAPISGNDIVRSILHFCERPQPIRIELKGVSPSANRVWIIA